MEDTESASTLPKRDLPSNDSNPPKILIINRNISEDASIMTLSHPRTRIPTRYFICPESGIFELRKLASSTSPTSWLLQTIFKSKEAGIGGDTDPSAQSMLRGYVSKTSDVYGVTPFDPLFLILPALEKQCPYQGERANTQLLCMDDLFEELSEDSKHFRYLMRTPFAKVVEKRLAAVCQMVEVDEKMYRLDHEKLLKELICKAKVISASGLPPTMEAKFVTRPLEKPVCATTLTSLPAEQSLDGKETANLEGGSASQTASATSSILDTQDSVDTCITTPDHDQLGSDDVSSIIELQRVKTAISLILGSYFSSEWEKYILVRLSETTSLIDFGPLEKYLNKIAQMKEEALAARSMADFSRKRGLEDDELMADRADKRKKLEEDEKRRKANESRGVKELKKVNVAGMKKMGDFFKKLPAKV